MPMTRPASAGPTTRPRFHCALERAIAPTRSSRGTRSGSTDWYAGNPIALAHPLANTIRVTTAALGDPPAVSTVRSAANAIWMVVVVRSSALRGKRSARAPPTGPSSPPGTNAAAATSPVHPASPVRVVTYTPMANASICVPTLERNAPVQNAANTRWRNGAKGLVIGGPSRDREPYPRASAGEVLRARDEDRHDHERGPRRPVPAVGGDLCRAPPAGGGPQHLERARPQGDVRRVVAERLAPQIGLDAERAMACVAVESAHVVRHPVTADVDRGGVAGARGADRVPDVVLVGHRVAHHLPGDGTEARDHRLHLRAGLAPLVEERDGRQVASGRDLRLGPCVARDALEPAREDVGGDTDEVRENVVHAPFGGRGRHDRTLLRRGRAKKGVDANAQVAVRLGEVGHRVGRRGHRS